MWGRWGLRDGLEKHRVVDEEEYEELKANPKYEVRNPIYITETKILAIYKVKEQYVESHPTSSVFLAARTT